MFINEHHQMCMKQSEPDSILIHFDFAKDDRVKKHRKQGAKDDKVEENHLKSA